MSNDNWNPDKNLVPQSYFQQSCEALRQREKKIEQLIQHKKLPDEEWDDQNIEYFLNRLSLMDSNNFPSNCGVGEREARFASGIVARRYFRFGHGIGRSGNLREAQPKAAGSTLISNVTHCLIADLLQLMGIEDKVNCLVAPMATGMSLVLTMLTFRTERPKSQYVIWSRIDQKSCVKSILTAGFVPVIIEPLLEGSQLVTDVNKIDEKIDELGDDSILCILTTTSCFAPRACDSIESVARICHYKNIPHLINNAYGLQSRYYMKRIQKSQRNDRRVDVFVQSTDKNLMVPVGGTIIASFSKYDWADKIAKMYPGRASSGPVIDAFITLLSLGKRGYNQLVDKRDELFDYLRQQLCQIALRYGEEVLHTPENRISMAMTLKTISKENCTKIGAMLFTKNVSGARVVIPNELATISSQQFKGWGSHCENYTYPYLTCASSIGMTKKDVDLFIKRLNKVFNNKHLYIPAKD